VITLGDYRAEEGLRAWILALKHGSRPDLARPLGRLLGARLGSGEDGAWLVPVPLHPLRRLERGYDQARLLARFAAEFVGLPVVEALRRTQWTVPQGTPGARSRRANVRGAFVVARRKTRGLARRSVVLVDDVVTSGATVDACASALRSAGATSVDVLCLARAG
jgi:ComF family protein